MLARILYIYGEAEGTDKRSIDDNSVDNFSYFLRKTYVVGTS